MGSVDSVNLVSRGYAGIKRAGLSGCIKSAYYSTKYTRKPTSLVLHSKVIPDISPDTRFDINNQLFIGTKTSSGSHPRMARSKFRTTAGSSVAHTGDRHAKIGPGSVVHVGGDFSMGDSYINGFSRIVCADEITIGDGCAVSWDCDIMDNDGHQIIYDDGKPPRLEPVEIRDDVWIGRSVLINKGVTIHEGSVVASGSVVVSDVPANTLVAGSPAEVIREDVSWEE